MITKPSRNTIRIKKHSRMHGRKSTVQSGMPETECLSDNKHIYAQIVNDTEGKTLVSVSTLQPDEGPEFTDNVEAAKKVGKVIGERAVQSGIKEVVFDRGGYIYHGKIQALADAKDVKKT